MDEELEQPNNKINLDSFFKSIESVEKVATNALNIANSNLNVIQQQKSLIDAISISITNLQTEVREITNTIIVEKKLAEDRQEDLRFENEDKEQKQRASERLEGEKGAKGDTGQQGQQGQPGQIGGGEGLKTGLLGTIGAFLSPILPVAALGGLNIVEKLINPLGIFNKKSISSFATTDSTFGDRKPRGLTGIFGGMADALTGNRTDFDGRGSGKKDEIKGVESEKNQVKEEIKSEIKQELSLFDGDEKGKKRNLFGTMGGIVDSATGNLTDFDRRGGKPSGSRGGLDLFGFEKKRKKSNYDNNPRVIANKKKIDELRSKRDQLEMETIINPDGSITSKGSGTLVGGELYKPGEEMSLRQRQATQLKILMNGEDSVDPQRLKDYKNSGGALSKEEASVISDLEGVEPGAFTEVSDEEAKRQIEAEDNPFASILSPFVDKFKNFSEGLEKSSLGESLKDEKIPKQLESVAKDIGSKIDPKDIKDVVIKTVVKKFFVTTY